MGMYNSYAISGPTDRTIREDSEPGTVENMSLETFKSLSYKEQVIIKRHWPAVYERLTAPQESRRDV